MSVEIGRLVLDAPGLDESQARALAERVGLALGGAKLRGSAERISLTAPKGADPEALAARIVAAVLDRLGEG